MNARIRARDAYPIRAESASTGKTSCPGLRGAEEWTGSRGMFRSLRTMVARAGPSLALLYCFYSLLSGPRTRFSSRFASQCVARFPATSRRAIQARCSKPPVYSDILIECRLSPHPLGVCRADRGWLHCGRTARLTCKPVPASRPPRRTMSLRPSRLLAIVDRT